MLLKIKRVESGKEERKKEKLENNLIRLKGGGGEGDNSKT